MTMESPVRICLGAALVVHLLLLSSTKVSANALPHETTSTTVRDEKNPRIGRANTTSWVLRQNVKSPDISLNELSPKESPAEENTEKNAKYKHRGRVRYNPQAKSTTESILRRVRSTTETPNIIIVTPTPEVKKPAQIIDSMRTYKRTKMPVASTTASSTTTSTNPSTSTTSSTTTSTTTGASAKIIKKEAESQSEEEEEYEDEDDEEKESFEKYTTSDFDSNFFSIPSYNDFPGYKQSDKKTKEDYSSPSFGGFSTFFPSFGPKDEDHESYSSDTFFNFGSELTTPKNDFFDKRFQQISESIQKKLVSSAPKSKSNSTNVHFIKENIGLENLNNNTPSNKSTVYIKNTKEIRLRDNEGASSANKELSDVQGTSIYYEMSVLSTETYAIENSDDDCDNDTFPIEPTMSTSAEEELASLKESRASLFSGPTKPTYPDPFSISGPTKRAYPDPVISSTKTTINKSSPKSITIQTKSTSGPTKMAYSNLSSEALSTLSSNYLSVSSLLPDIYNSVSPIPVSTANTINVQSSTQNPINEISSTDRTVKIYSSTFTRNRSYSKRLNLNGTRDSPNSVTSRTDTTSVQSKPQTRRFHHTTPKNKSIWMAPPRRNISRVLPTRPTTIYSEHFNIRDKYSTTPKYRQPNRTMLTTVSSEIDPVLQTDIGGVEKVVHSPSISDNSIPSVWKRGSTRYTTSSSGSSETGGISDLEIPPTLTAWALASLRSPPSLASAVNSSGSTQKSVDENELQKVGEVTDKKEIAMISSTTTPSTLNNDIETKKITEVENKLSRRPIFPPLKPKSTTKTDTEPKKPESLPAESVISLQASATPTETTESMSPQTTTSSSNWKINTEIGVPVTLPAEPITESLKVKAIPTVGATRTTSFESITKFPSSVTTPPQDETAASSEQKNQATIQETKEPTTTDYEITTIRFSYVPIDDVTSTESSDTSTMTTMANTVWHAAFPTRTKQTTIIDAPVTTYRPMYMTTDQSEEATTILPDITSTTLEISPEEVTMAQKVPDTTEMMTQTTIAAPVTTTTEITTEEPVTELITSPVNEIIVPIETTTPLETTVQPETTSIVTEVVTEINTEIQTKHVTTEIPSTTETPPAELHEETDCTSEENSDSNEIITQEATKSTTTPKTSNVIVTSTSKTTTEVEIETTPELTTLVDSQETTDKNAKIHETTTTEGSEESSSEDASTKSVSDLEDVSSYNEDMTTEANARVKGVSEEDTSSGPAVAIAVSTIGVIALILLIGLLLVVRRRGRRGVYAQRCTPVSLDAYSLDSVSVGHRKGNHRLRASKRSYGNPAYDDEVTSHPMQYAALANFAMDVESITAEFAEIPSVTVRPDEVPPGCEDKNRYSNVLPLPETRVPLRRMGNDATSEYINANYITGPGNIRNYYIACQAPLSNTVVDFWRMIWEQNSRLIVMLTEYMENGVEKCYEYLPPSEISDNRRTFGDYQIILKKREQRDKYAISTVQLINLGTRTWREVTHMWYFWPAKGVPDDYDSIIDFLSEMRSYMKVSQTAKEYDEEGVEVIYGDMNRSSFGNLSKLRSDDGGSGNGLNVYSPQKAEEQMRRGNATNGTLGRMKTASEIEGIRPCVVTCASGAGRSAALIAVDVCARALAAGAADVPRVVRELRAQRPHSLSNRHHYIFLYKVLSEYGNKLMGGGVDTI